MAALRAKTRPTNVLHVRVPLDLTEPAPDFDAVADAVRVVLALTRAAYDRYICNDVTVDMETCPDPTPQPIPGQMTVDDFVNDTVHPDSRV